MNAFSLSPLLAVCVREERKDRTTMKGYAPAPIVEFLWGFGRPSETAVAAADRRGAEAAAAAAGRRVVTVRGIFDCLSGLRELRSLLSL